MTLQWRHNERYGVSNHQPHNCLLNRLFRRRSKKIWKLRVPGLCVGNSPVTGEFLAQMASNAENASIWWRHHELILKIMDKIDWYQTTTEHNKAEYQDVTLLYQHPRLELQAEILFLMTFTSSKAS